MGCAAERVYDGGAKVIRMGSVVRIRRGPLMGYVGIVTAVGPINAKLDGVYKWYAVAILKSGDLREIMIRPAYISFLWQVGGDA